MQRRNHINRRVLRGVVMAALSSSLMACATSPPASPDQLDVLPGAVSFPYKISDAGHVILNIRVNGTPAQPFLLDTGANVSAVYKNDASSMGLTPTDKVVSVNGLVGNGPRPIAENVTFQIGGETVRQDHIVILDRPKAENEAMGLLGVDVLADYVLQFNKDTMTVTLIQSDKVGGAHFSGWQKIPLRNRVGTYPDNGLYFASVQLRGEDTPVLIDTGSELNIVNWPLASLDPKIGKAMRKIRDKVEFEGAIDSFPLQMRTVFYAVELGDQSWPEVPVIIMDFDALTTIAPADRPLMIAGVSMFTPTTFAFDFEDNMIYILPED